jgi:hypothetical protein
VAIGTEEGAVSRPEVAGEEVVAGLNDLLQLDHDALGAYEIAIEQLENREHALQIEGFRKDHQRHVQVLNDLILSMGGTPRNEPHATAPLKQGLQKVAGVGGDRGILLAWRANELQVMSRYDHYARKAAAWPADAKRVVDENALDEERHYQWVADLISDGETPEVQALNRVREGIAQARIAGARARGRLGSAAGAARLRAADGVESTAERLQDLAAREGPVEGVRGSVAEGAQRLARSLDSTAARLREGGDSDIRSSIEEELRANPGRSLVASFAIGFILGRIIR